MILEKTGSQTIADNASNDVDFGTVITDTHNGFDSSGDIVYTCKQTGFYQIDVTAVSDEVGKAHEVIVSMKGKFPRKIMPQADFSGAVGGQDGVNKSLERGAINYKEPFGEGMTLKEQFQKIAKIKK